MIKIIIATITTILISINFSIADTSCIETLINEQVNNQKLLIKANTNQCIKINNQSNDNISIFADSIGAKLDIKDPNKQHLSADIFGHSYTVAVDNNTIDIKVVSSISNKATIIVSTEKYAENAFFRYYTTNFLLLGLIFSAVTFNTLYSVTKKSPQAFFLSLLTSFSIAFFFFECIAPQINIKNETYIFIVKLFSFLSCTSGYLLLHSFIGIQKKGITVVSLIILTILATMLSPHLAIEYYRAFFLLVILHVLIAIAIEIKNKPHLWWYLAGSIFPSLASIIVMVMSSSVPTIISYNLALGSILLQNLMISKAITSQDINRNEQILSSASKTEYNSSYINYCQQVLIPQLSSTIEFINHSGKDTSQTLPLKLIELTLFQYNRNTQMIADDLLSILGQHPEITVKQQLCDNLQHILATADPALIDCLFHTIKYLSDEKAADLTATRLNQRNIFITMPFDGLALTIPTRKDTWLILDDDTSLTELFHHQCTAINQKHIIENNQEQAIASYLAMLNQISHIFIDWNLANGTALNTLLLFNTIHVKHHIKQPTIYLISGQDVSLDKKLNLPIINKLQKPVNLEKLIAIKNNVIHQVS